MTHDQPPHADIQQEHVAAVVERYVRDVGMADDDPQFSRSAHLFDEGYVDSLGTLGLIDLLERSFSVVLPAEILMDPGFSSVDGIAALVAAAARSAAGP